MQMAINRLQNRVLLVLAAAAMGGAALLSISHGAYFEPYFGGMAPVLATAMIVGLGIFSFRLVHFHGLFEVYPSGAPFRRAPRFLAITTLFFPPVILADFWIGFPQDINVLLPWSLLFYPTMGLVAEMSFHVLPLALLLVPLKLFEVRDAEKLVWPAILLVSAIEPGFQIRSALASQSYSLIDIFVALHIFFFSLVQLYAFRRHGFVLMLAIRLYYYLGWHIVWGSLRLPLLFCAT